MKNCFSTKVTLLAASMLVSSGVAFGHNAGEVGTATEGHLRDSNNHPVKNTSGECWHLGATPGAPDCEVQPPPPAPAPIPAPPPPKPIQQPVKQKVTLQGDALFDFNKAVLKTEYTKALDEEIEKIRAAGATTEAIKITGHTDSIGTDAYNDKLSLRRAQAVKDYMVQKNVDPNKITVEGKGKRQPITTNKTKEGRAKNRRVEIEYTGFEMITPK